LISRKSLGPGLRNNVWFTARLTSGAGQAASLLTIAERGGGVVYVNVIIIIIIDIITGCWGCLLRRRLSRQHCIIST